MIFIDAKWNTYLLTSYEAPDGWDIHFECPTREPLRNLSYEEWMAFMEEIDFVGFV